LYSPAAGGSIKIKAVFAVTKNIVNNLNDRQIYEESS
jgi:hypothetical protein